MRPRRTPDFILDSFFPPGVVDRPSTHRRSAHQVWDADRLQLHEKDAAPPLVQTVKLFAPKFPEAPVRSARFSIHSITALLSLALS